METQVAVILAALVLAFVLWIAKTVSDTKQEVAVIKSVLVGAKGENGLVGDLKILRGRTHELSDIIHTVVGQQALHTMRMDHYDARTRTEDKAPK